MSTNIENALYLYGNHCEYNKTQLEDWFNEAIVKLATQGGQSIASTSANGIQVSFMTGLSLADWITALSNVLNRLNSPTVIRHKSILAFR